MFRRGVAFPLAGLLAIAVSMSFGLTSCGSKQTTSTVTSQLPVIDGAIEADEYKNHYHNAQINMDLYWSITGDDIYLGLKSPGQGWVAIGLDPTGPIMQGADILIGYIQNGRLYLADEYAADITSHIPDTQLGGRDDLLQKAGSESEQGTVLEFMRKLNTRDRHDQPIASGRRIVMLAYSDSDDTSGYHGETAKRRAIAFIDFFKAD